MAERGSRPGRAEAAAGFAGRRSRRSDGESPARQRPPARPGPPPAAGSTALHPASPHPAPSPASRAAAGSRPAPPGHSPCGGGGRRAGGERGRLLLAARLGARRRHMARPALTGGAGRPRPTAATALAPPGTPPTPTPPQSGGREGGPGREGNPRGGHGPAPPGSRRPALPSAVPGGGTCQQPTGEGSPPFYCCGHLLPPFQPALGIRQSSTVSETWNGQSRYDTGFG